MPEQGKRKVHGSNRLGIGLFMLVVAALAYWYASSQKHVLVPADSTALVERKVWFGLRTKREPIAAGYQRLADSEAYVVKNSGLQTVDFKVPVKGKMGIIGIREKQPALLVRGKLDLQLTPVLTAKLVAENKGADIEKLIAEPLAYALNDHRAEHAKLDAYGEAVRNSLAAKLTAKYDLPLASLSISEAAQSAEEVTLSVSGLSSPLAALDHLPLSVYFGDLWRWELFAAIFLMAARVLLPPLFLLVTAVFASPFFGVGRLAGMDLESPFDWDMPDLGGAVGGVAEAVGEALTGIDLDL